MKIAIRLIYLDSSNEPTVKDLTNVDITETLESIASKHMDTTSHQILNVIVDSEIADRHLPLSSFYPDDGGDEAAREGEAGDNGEEEEEEMKVAHIMLQEMPKSRHCGDKIQIFVKNISNRIISIRIDRFASVLELKEKIHDREGDPVEDICLIYRGRIQKDEISYVFIRGVFKRLRQF